MSTLVNCLRFLRKSCREQELHRRPEQNIVDCAKMVLTSSSRVWEALWNIRTPFLDLRPRESSGRLDVGINFAILRAAGLVLDICSDFG